MDGCVFVKLISIYESELREDFVITCNINYVTVSSGEKVNLISAMKQKVEQDAISEFCYFISDNSPMKFRLKALIV